MGHIRLLFSQRYAVNGTWQTQVTAGDSIHRARYGAQQLESIEFAGEDHSVVININAGRVYEHWLIESYPDPEVRNRVLTLMYFVHKAIDLDGLTDEIRISQPTSRQALLALGEQALTIIDSLATPPPPVRPHVPRIRSLRDTLRQQLRSDVRAISRLPTHRAELQWFLFKVSRQQLMNSLDQAASQLRRFGQSA